MNPQPKNQSAGFTLIEMLVAIFILAFIAVFTSQSLQSSIKFQTKFQKNQDQDGRLKSALALMDRDISMAFHSQNLVEQLNQQVASGGKTPVPGQQTVPGQPPLATAATGNTATKKINWTQFWGDESKLYFTSRSNVRLSPDIAESDIIKVGYELKSCGGSLGSGATHILSCVWRITSPVVVDPIDQGGTEQVLIENVKEFKLRYIGAGKDDWDSKWYTDSRGDASSFDKFPQAVQIHVVTEEERPGKRRETAQDAIAMIRFPNNEDPTAPAGGTTTTPGGLPPAPTNPGKTALPSPAAGH